MLILSPKAKRFIGEALRRYPDAGVRDSWSSVDQITQWPIWSRIVLAALAYFSAILELELANPTLEREARIKFSNDLWFVSDLISEITDSLPTGQPTEFDPYLPSLTGGASDTPPKQD